MVFSNKIAIINFMKSKKTIVICASASLYEKIIPIENDLKKLGYKVVIPITARRMKRKNDFTLNKSWTKNPNDYYKKRKLMNLHFKEILKGDLILVANFDKKENKHYIGGNVLMEMTIAYYFKKPIFLLFEPDPDSILNEEIIGVAPKILNGDLSKIKI